MSTRCRTGAALVAMVLATGAAFAACEPEQPWRHEHAGAKPDTETTDVAGTRKTTIRICRAAAPAGVASVKVETSFEGSRGFGELASGDCNERFAKWGVVKSIAARASDGEPSVVEGTYQVCRE